MKFRRDDPKAMPWYYYLGAILILLVLTYVAMYLAGEVSDPIEFLLNLKQRSY